MYIYLHHLAQGKILMLSKEGKDKASFVVVILEKQQKQWFSKEGDGNASYLKHSWLIPAYTHTYRSDSVTRRCGVSKACLFALHRPPWKITELPTFALLTDGSRVSAPPTAVVSDCGPGLLAARLGHTVNTNVLWIVPDKWIKYCDQTISLFTYQESTVLLIRCFVFHLCCSSLFLLCSVFSSHAWTKSLGVLSSCDHETFISSENDILTKSMHLLSGTQYWMCLIYIELYSTRFLK